MSGVVDVGRSGQSADGHVSRPSLRSDSAIILPLRMRSRERPRVRILSSAAGVVMALVLVALASGCARTTGYPAPSSASPAATAPAAAAAEDPVRMAVVGDSLSEGDSADFSGGDFGDRSWLPWALDERVVFAGGWAVSGALTEAMAENVRPYDADVLVILGGTNDLALGIDLRDTQRHLVEIADTASVERVVLVGVPPIDFAPDTVGPYNQALRELAAERGWEFADAAAELRAPDETFREGLTWDGLHPTAEGARLLGEAIRAHVLR
ncbi:SGNH/GDSL hydrolase family protein [Microbacterium lushaniae]|nr:SGNH/GDSL hydrolase family protein [Microbacterium lushaniae]KAA9159687.1 SGNH/GDSL hydrolase family protein [Microbacterium lushaniae]